MEQQAQLIQPQATTIQSQIPCICIKTQSIRVEVDFQRMKLNCLASYDLTIKYSDSKENVIDLNSKMDFVLYARQLDINEIKFVPIQNYFQLVDQRYFSNQRQSIAFKYQKPLKTPCSYIALNYALNDTRDSTQKISLFFKFIPDQLPSTDYDYLKSLEETLLFKVQIQYTINQPISGLRFLINKSQEQLNKYLITEKHMHNSRNWVPTPLFKHQVFPPYSHQEKDLLHYSKIIIVVEKQYYALVSGQLSDEYEIENTNQRAFIYEINDFINPDDLGIFVGKFKSFYSEFEEFKMLVFHTKDYSSNIFENEYCKKIIDDIDRFWFKDPLLQKTRDQLGIGSGAQFFSKTNILILPSIFLYKYFSFYPFRNIIVFDDVQIPAQIPCKKIQDEFHRCFTLQLNSLAIKQFLAPSCNLSDKWIEMGFAFQASWMEDYSKINELVIKQVRNGQDVKLEQSQFEQRFVVESMEYQIKTRMVITMLARMTHQPEKFIKEILKRFYQDQLGNIPAALSTETILTSIKKVFCVPQVKTLKKMFINSIGGWHFKVAYDQDKDNKLILNITQHPIIGPWAQLYTTHYLQGEKHLKEQSEITSQYSLYNEKLRQMQKQIIKSLKDFEEQQKEPLDSQNRRILNSSCLKEFRRKDYTIQASGLLPQELGAQLHFSGLVRIHVSETNELKLENQNEEIKISAKLWSKIEVNRPQIKLKKLNIPKRHLEINAQSYLEKTADNGFLEVENDNTGVQPPMIHGILGEAIMKSGVKIKQAKQLSEQIQKEPPQWVKWDPEGFMIKEVEFQLQKESIVVQCQILKEKDMNQIACILRNIKKVNLREICVNLLVEIIETSYSYLESDIIIQLLELIMELVNKNSEKRQEDNAEFEDLIELQAYLKLAEKIIYRFFYNQSDNSIKYLRIQNHGDYDVILQVFKCLGKLETISQLGFHNELIEILIQILVEYDNSQNTFDCSLLISKLVKLLLNSNCNSAKFKVLKAILHELRKVVFKSEGKNYILKNIILYYNQFVEINFESQKEIKIQEVFKKYDDQIREILKFHQYSLLPKEDNNYLEIAYYKVELLDSFNRLEPYHFILNQLLLLSKVRLKKGYTSIVFYLYLQKLQEFTAKNYQIFAQELSRNDVNLELATTLAYTAFESIITGPSLLNYSTQNNFTSIYRVLYYYFAPLHYTDELKEKMPTISHMLIGFQADQGWCNQNKLQLQDELDELNNKTGIAAIKKARPVNRVQQQDIESSLNRFAEKNPNKVNEREVTRYILRYISSLPKIRILEENKETLEASPQSKQFHSIDQVKQSMKRKSQSMDTIQRNVLSVFRYYNEKGVLEQIPYEDYCQLVSGIFSDGRRFLEQFRIFNTQKKIEKVQIKLEQDVLAQQNDFLEHDNVYKQTTIKLPKMV